MPTPFPPKLKLHHHTPGWVPDGETFHLRIRVDRDQPVPLTAPGHAPVRRSVTVSLRQLPTPARDRCVIALASATITPLMTP